ncbi:lysis protein [Cronobacter sakazakii]|uniref:lysis protein n=1 Tax=Cronobacter sakazakii TaxID=28141 RepID=UPI000CF0DC30|nr:lysis protein [Cronobacter sakazakii]ELY2616903.1 lysis protein [Cronobacter sakazakii]ELY2632744.1 lysis protein [Cronobacter sakazakii]ELY2662978.1 lysis protein [Cronobacter sakazakii]ELY4116619.1 lysis protein [Cronobacter sakazakii]ELY4499946.1 lysis protein [Cronobacter sakazakii]
MLSRLLGLLALIAILTSFHYHDQFKESQASLTAVNRELNAVKDAKEKMLEGQRKLAELDAWYTGEIARVKAENDQLRADVANGTRRLQLNATCERVRNASGTTGGSDATAPRLDDAAQRDYFTLRERIATITAQMIGLQIYVREQCQ